MRVGQSGVSVCQYYTGNYGIRQTPKGNWKLHRNTNTNLHVYLQCEKTIIAFQAF